MPTLKLNRLLVGVVLLSGFIALFISTSFILYRLDQDMNVRLQQAADNAKHQLTMQLMSRVVIGALAASSYPDFHLWRRSDSHLGLCLSYENDARQQIRSICRGGMDDVSWPEWFEFSYTALFQPQQEVTETITYNDEVQGYIRVFSSKNVMLSQAWESFKQLFELALLIVVVLCVLLFFTLHMAVRPARVLRQVLVDLEHDGLNTRAPEFKVEEWQMISSAINKLVDSLGQTLKERQRLSLKLVDLQEEERRYLCRELHDELGQSLAGLSAVARFLNQEAEKKHPHLLASTEQVYETSQSMMQLVKHLMIRLRPADFDELGLSESLRSYVDEWNQKHHDIDCSLTIDGDVDSVPDVIAMNVLRIMQECLTNISKHAEASQAEVFFKHRLDPSPTLTLRILDNGKLSNMDFIEQSGKGLLGIRERVFALDGQLQFEPYAGGGLEVMVKIPLPLESNNGG